MAVTLQCPDNAMLLRLFGQGGSHEEMESLARHVEQCTRCGERIDEMLRKDEISLGLARPVDGTDMPDSEALIKLRRRLELLRPADPSDKTTDPTGEAPTGASDPAVPATLPMSGSDHGVNFLAPAQQPDEIGRLGPYRVLKKLGIGGMGMVLLAEDAMLKRKVALKVMLPNIAVNPQARERFLREARAAAAIEHQHIIAIHQVGEDNGVPFLAMPLLKGESLDDRLKREKKLPINEAVRITCEMADGLAAAHAQGLIHRDIKPGNVWLEEQAVRAPAAGPQAAPPARRPAKVKVLDFGLARSQAEEVQLTQSGAIVGTPAFMAPEQARGLPVDARADLFSLGCVLYVMLTGKRPFTGDSTMALLTALALDTPKSPRAVNPTVPAVLSDFTMRLLAKKPEDRPASADAALDEMRAMIRTAAAARKAVAPSPHSTAAKTAIQPAPSQPEPRPKKAAACSPRRRVALLVGLALLFVIGGGFAAYQLVFKTNDGELIVKVDDDADVRFRNGELQIMDADGKLKYTLKPSEKNKTLPPGKYLVKVAGVDGLKIEADKFEIIRNGKTTVRVTVASVAPAAEKNADPDREAAAWVLSIGGIVKVDDLDREIRDAADLPTEPFQLTGVNLENNAKVSTAGLSHCEGCRNLKYLALAVTSTTDTGLAHFQHCKKLKILSLWKTQISDAGLAYFTDCDLTNLSVSGTRVSDAGLAVFKNCKNLTELDLGNTRVSDAGLASFKDCKNLARLDLMDARVSDAGLAMFKDCKNLTRLQLDRTLTSDAGLAVFKDCKNLSVLCLQGTKVTAAKVAEFRKALPGCDIEWDGGVNEPKALSVDDAWIKQVRTLPADKQVEAVAAKLKELNPGFDGEVRPLIEDGAVVEFGFFVDYVSDISPVQALKELRTLYCTGSAVGKGRLRDLSPLRNMKLTTLFCDFTKVVDLAPLKDMKVTILFCADTKVSDLSPLRDLKLTKLWCCYSQVSDLSPLRDMKMTGLDLTGTHVVDLSPLRNMKLTILRCGNTQVSDLSPLKDMPLQILLLDHTRVTDLSLLRGMPLKELYCDFDPKRDADILRSIKTLETINGKPAADFWKDMGAAGKPAAQKDADADRKAAEWMLSIGGTVAVNDARNEIKAVADLPRTPFQLVAARLKENKQVSDAGLACFKDCKNLTAVDISNTQAGDAGLACFKGCTNVTHLYLGGTQVTNAGLADLKDWKKLGFLGLGGTRVNDAGLVHIKDCKNLEMLFFDHENVTDAGLALLNGETMTALGLAGTKVSDDGLAYLKNNKIMFSLILKDTKVSDAGLENLKGLAALKELDLTGSKVTAAGVKKLAAVLLKCKITWDGGVIEPKP